MGGDFFLGSVLASTMTKLALKLVYGGSGDSNNNNNKNAEVDQVTKNLIVAEALLVAVSIIRLGQSTVPPNLIDAGTYQILFSISIGSPILIPNCNQSMDHSHH